MADIAQLGTLKEPEFIDPASYEDGGKGGTNTPAPDEGRYFGQLPQIDDSAFGQTNEGYLKVTIDPIVIVNSPEGNGHKVRFTRLSAKKYSTRNGSQMMDLLRACGIAASPKTNLELVGLIKSASGRVCQFQLELEGYNKGTDTTFKVRPRNDEAQIPLDTTTGKPARMFKDPIDGATVFSNSRVRYFVSAVSSGSNGNGQG